MSERLVSPGSWTPGVDRWGRFGALARTLRGEVLALCDERVLRLHPQVAGALRAHRVVRLRAGEGLKRLATVERLAARAVDLPRSTTVLAVGGGTVGDVAAVFAHLFKRGVRLVQVPTTLLAAVDSSVGGKGAVNVGAVKNALGVFHNAGEAWLCPELFRTLAPRQLREGALEAMKMAVTLDVRTWRDWRAALPALEPMVRQARALKGGVCEADPYEQGGGRVALNFGHSFGHVLEAVTRFSLRHGEAVGLGMLCALDVGRALRVTAPQVALDVEAALPNGPAPRRRLARALRAPSPGAVEAVLAADKKRAGRDLRMVLLVSPGRWTLEDVPAKVWRRLLGAWQRGERP